MKANGVPVSFYFLFAGPSGRRCSPDGAAAAVGGVAASRGHVGAGCQGRRVSRQRGGPGARLGPGQHLPGAESADPQRGETRGGLGLRSQGANTMESRLQQKQRGGG